MRLRAVRIAAHTLAITALDLLSADSGQAAQSKAAPSKAAPRARPSPPPLSAESRKCVTCHSQKTPGIVAQWKGSRHAVEGVGCWECHNATAKEPGAFE